LLIHLTLDAGTKNQTLTKNSGTQSKHMHKSTPLLILAETAVRSSVAQDTVAMVTMTTHFLALQGWEREKNVCVCACVSVEN